MKTLVVVWKPFRRNILILVKSPQVGAMSTAMDNNAPTLFGDLIMKIPR